MYIKRLKDLREDHDLTQEQVSKILGINRPQYNRYERGINELPIRHLIALSKYYGVSTDYILELE